MIEIDGLAGELYNIRMIIDIRNKNNFFLYKTKNSTWVKRSQVKVIEKK